ncbi:MAG: hypothetical protein J6M47_04360 [Clostridia bacterium]|nr:hypothetical protein [Clostridia bacterium]
MRPTQRSSERILEQSRRIASVYRRSLIFVLSFSFIMMVIQAVTDITEVAAAPVFLFALWLISGPIALLVWGGLRLYAARLKKREAEQLSQLAQARQIATFRAAEDAREAAREKAELAATPASLIEAAPPAPSNPQESALAAGLPDIIPTPGSAWRDKALAPNEKAAALEGLKPAVFNDDWRERLVRHAERLNRWLSSDIELMRREKDGQTSIIRMREEIGYYYIDLHKPAQDGTLVRSGWGPLSPQNVLAISMPDHPEVAARVLAAAAPEQRETLQHVLNDLLDAAPIAAGAARSWNDMLYMCREIVTVHNTEDGIEFRMNTEQNPTPRNPDPRKIHHSYWLTVKWAELPSRSMQQCAALMRERNPLASAWWISRLMQDKAFAALFTQPE